MNIEFPDKNIMLVTDYEELGPDEGPKEGSRWTMVFDGALNALGNGIGAIIIFPLKVAIHLSALDCASTVRITWLNTRRAFWA